MAEDDSDKPPEKGKGLTPADMERLRKFREKYRREVAEEAERVKQAETPQPVAPDESLAAAPVEATPSSPPDPTPPPEVVAPPPIVVESTPPTHAAPPVDRTPPADPIRFESPAQPDQPTDRGRRAFLAGVLALVGLSALAQIPGRNAPTPEQQRASVTGELEEKFRDVKPVPLERVDSSTTLGPGSAYISLENQSSGSRNIWESMCFVTDKQFVPSVERGIEPVVIVAGDEGIVRYRNAKVMSAGEAALQLGLPTPTDPNAEAIVLRKRSVKTEVAEPHRNGGFTVFVGAARSGTPVAEGDLDTYAMVDKTSNLRGLEKPKAVFTVPPVRK